MENNIFNIIFNILFLLIAPFFALGIIKKTKAFFAGKKGISILQPFWDFLKLLKKEQVISNSTSWIFRFAPLVIFSSIFIAGLFAPMCNGNAVIEIQGAFIIFSYLLGLSKFFALISALDCASSFEGMGASREVCFTTIVEPAFFIILASIILLSENFTFKSIHIFISTMGNYGILISLIAIIALLIMLLVECSRVPMDDPETHLELTMIHEVMILDNSGIDLALISYSSGMKMIILASLIANFIIPSSISSNWSYLIFPLVIAIISTIIGIIESAIARFRMSHILEFVFVMSSLALIVASLAANKLYGV